MIVVHKNTPSKLRDTERAIKTPRPLNWVIQSMQGN